MSLTISIFLIVYAILVALFIVYSLFNLYHILRFGFMDFYGFLAVFLFLGATAIIFFITFNLALGIDWNYQLFNLDFNQLGSSNFIK